MTYSGGMESIPVCETFASIQGESTYAGYACWFIRLSGCNLTCRYCDTPHARSAGTPVAISDLVLEAKNAGLPLVEITGGEPLLHDGFAALAAGLIAAGIWKVLVETNGSLDLSVVPESVIRIVDVKCPGSGAGGSFLPSNLEQFRPDDEIKFVVTDRPDFDWSCRFIEQHRLPERVHAVLVSPVRGVLDPRTLAEWVLESKRAIQLQVPLHTRLGMP